jgi:hypothetical protein
MLQKLRLIKRDSFLLIVIPLFYVILRVYLLRDGGLRFAAFIIATLWEAKLLLPLARKFIKPMLPVQQLFPVVFVIIPVSIITLALETASPQFLTNLPLLSPFLQLIMAVSFASTLAMRDESDPDWLTNELTAFDNIWLVLLWGGLLVVLGDIFAQALSVAWNFSFEAGDLVTRARLDTSLVIPATIAFNVLLWREREGKKRPLPEQFPIFLIAIVLAIISYIAIQNLWLLPQVWGATVPALIQEWAVNPQNTVILAFALVGVLAQRRQIPWGIAIVSLAAVIGGIGAVLLSYPAYVTLFEQFIPGALTVVEGGRTAVTIQITLAILLFLATGPLIVWWLRPGTRRRQFFMAAVTGAVIATFLYGFLIGPIITIAAHSPIYDVATTRAGLGGFDWVIKLAEAANNVILAVPPSCRNT